MQFELHLIGKKHGRRGCADTTVLPWTRKTLVCSTPCERRQQDSRFWLATTYTAHTPVPAASSDLINPKPSRRELMEAWRARKTVGKAVRGESPGRKAKAPCVMLALCAESRPPSSRTS